MALVEQVSETRTLTFGSLFTAHENNAPQSATAHITNIVGWHDRSVVIESVPLLFGKGSTVQSTHVPEYTISFTVFFDGVNIYNIMNQITLLMEAFTPVTVTRSWSGGLVETRTVYIEGISDKDMKADGIGQITINTKCLNN